MSLMSASARIRQQVRHRHQRCRLRFASSGQETTPHTQTACPAAGGEESEQESESDEHGFCPCCLLTKSIEAFRPILETCEFAAIRLYAARDGEGEIQAVCRLNGEDYPAGKLALMDYVKTWPEMGFEFRKQLVVVRSVD
ncbi:DUF6348 family protein [Cupriavidus sp. CV2]|uniref:DUF6348 family protein n=1 Tax=Cupriavidus ulmosensis TaxID=3065913 RepID=UPI00296B3781|nr:DUF6348 family protein [Cupriavidus sp. CV2]MDW3684252.1 DUF6348 family protein [Cupriavidus sp. CV2]